uniref:Uncharacterized protein n=1 Tax=Rhizophora mucronata TaxID=61149 RepID=A0A2P2J4N4_RHIMU
MLMLKSTVKDSNKKSDNLNTILIPDYNNPMPEARFTIHSI